MSEQNKELGLIEQLNSDNNILRTQAKFKLTKVLKLSGQITAVQTNL